MLLTHPFMRPALDLGSDDPEVRLGAVRQFTRQLSQPGVLKTLRLQRLTALLYHTLTRFSREEVGEVPLMEELRRDYLQGLKGYGNQMRETRQVLQGLADAGVEVILLKGIYLRHRLYDDPVCRPMSDLDVLISPADVDRARVSLVGQGFTVIPRDLELRPGFTKEFGWVLCFQSPTGDLPIMDVHWEIQEVGTFYRLPYEVLRPRSVPWDLKGVPARVLAPEHLILHLCLHIFDELENATLLKIVDLDRALRSFPMDWDLLVNEAVRLRLQEPVACILREITHWRPGLAPESVFQRLSSHRPGWAERFIIRRQANTMLVASIMALYAHQPLWRWPAYFRAKFWPSSSYLEANTQSFASRADYLGHILGRAQHKT